jgi:SHS2 domain-containing protein
MKPSFRFLEHTADAKFQAFGRTVEEAFCHAAQALVSLMWDGNRIDRKIEIAVSPEGRDLPQLLVRFLEEILYLRDARMFLLSSAEEIHIGRKNGIFYLRGLFVGDIHRSGYRIHGEVKAITYNDIFVKVNRECSLQVVVDM